MNLLPSPLFYVPNKDTYPPFKNGLYLEEYFLEYMKKNNLTHDSQGRLYLPILWTNFQIEGWFNARKAEMQSILDEYIANTKTMDNQNNKGYFTVVQYDDGPLLKLPENTLVYGACSGTIPIPLIYQDINNTLDTKYNKFLECNQNIDARNILCSFVGTNTNYVRQTIFNTLGKNSKFILNYTNNWSASVDIGKQYNFIDTTLKSKFALAPRGYGRSSFRFFEIIKLGAIPVYVWNDIEWLPYKDHIDYSEFSVSINVADIGKLPEILESILASSKYNTMLEKLNQIKKDKIFDLDYLSNYISMCKSYE
jgi:hypothetical protein